jgi:hypothetical protein
MKEKAQVGLIIIFGLLIVFHILVLLKIIPYNIVWGGRLKTDADMYKFEFVSLLINTAFLILVLIKANHIKFQLNDTILAASFWAMASLFFLNTIGNLLSKNKLEKIIFTPLTILLTILTIVLAIN